MQFKIKKEEMTRVTAFSSYIKTLGAAVPLNDNCLFYIENNKLTMYVYGVETQSPSYSRITLDVEADSNFYFSLKLSQFENFLTKLKSDEVLVFSEGPELMKLKGDKTRTVFSQATLVKMNEVQVKDVVQSFERVLTLPSFQTPIKVDLSYTDDIITFCSLAKIVATNTQIKISKDLLQSADNVCPVLNIKTDTPIAPSDVLLLHGLANTIKNLTLLEVSLDGLWTHTKIETLGIESIFVQAAKKWDCLSEQEIIEDSPNPDDCIKITVNADTFYKALAEFDGVFDSASWQYKQINFAFETITTDSIKLYFDNASSYVETFLDLAKIEGDIKEDFMISIPTLHFKLLEKYLHTDENSEFTITLDKDSLTVVLDNGIVNANIVKME